LEAVLIILCEEVMRVNSLLSLLPFRRVANGGLHSFGI